MSIIVWNCRKLGNFVTNKDHGDLTRAKDPSVVFIAETWTGEARQKKKTIKHNLKFDHKFLVPRIHRGGGLVLNWKAGVVFRKENKAGVNVIIRDYRGKVIASMAKNFLLPFSVSVVEVIAAKKALKFASEFGLSTFVLEGDSKTTIDALLTEEVSLADIGHLIDEAKQYGD